MSNRQCWDQVPTAIPGGEAIKYTNIGGIKYMKANKFLYRNYFNKN